MPMTVREQENSNLRAQRQGQNTPLDLCPAHYDGDRSVRVEIGGKVIGMATTTYSYKLTTDERESAARRMAALWNLAAAFGWPTEQIEAMAAEKLKEDAGR